MFVPEAALIALREGLEAFLIVGILLGFVTKLGRPDARKWVWLGLTLGIAASLVIGILVQVFLLDTFEANGGGEWFELVAALVAVAVLTYMVFWMWQHTRGLMVGLRQKVGEALSRNTLGVIVLLTFASVIREGLEVVLFYGALANRNSGFDLAWSGLLGAALSVAMVFAIFKSTISLDLQKFFGITGVLLVFVAAGLLVHSVHAATDLGLLPHGDILWDTSGFISDDGAAGRVLHALFGYTAQPTLLQALLYFGFLFGVGIPYVASLGAFRTRPTNTLRKGRIVAVAVLIWMASLATVWGASTATPAAHDELGGAHGLDHAGVPHDQLLANATRALEQFSGKIGILIRDHGEPIHYNASTYESMKEFIQHIWPYTGLPPELLTLDQGSYFLDAAHPFSPTPQTGANLVDPWLKPWTLPAAPAGDIAEQGTLEDFCDHSPLYYFTPGAGPGKGEGDLFEIMGLCSYRDWLKMQNESPRYDQGLPTWTWLDYHLHKHFGDKVVVAFAHGHDPKVNPNETLDAAAKFLVRSGVTVVLDAYQSSIHSDAMDTCMMRPHAEHALHAAGFKGPIIRVGMAGHDPRWGDATAARAAELVSEFRPTVPVSVHLVHHGAVPTSKNPCGTGLDQYHANAQAEYDLASKALTTMFSGRGNVTVRMVYGQGAGASDDGVLSPLEAIDLDRSEGIRNVIMLPYEVWGDGVDTLVYLRESLGFTPAQSPYYDGQYETHLTKNGVSVTIPSAAYGLEMKSEALLAQIGKAIENVGDGA